MENNETGKHFAGCAVSSTPFILVSVILYMLKAIGYSISWWYVFGPILFFVGICVIAFLIAGIAGIISGYNQCKRF